MPITVCTYNVEDFYDCFTDAGTPDRESHGEQLQAVADVISAVDPDLLGIVESPPPDALEAFATAYGLRQATARRGYPAGGERQLTLLYDDAVIKAVTHVTRDGDTGDVPPFDGEFVYDAEGDGIEEVYDFYRPPFEAAVTPAEGGSLRVILAHAKSKLVYGVRDQIHRERESLANRRKLLAQCTWIRRRVEHLQENHPVVVMGDFNDGPGLDQYERRFGTSAVEVVMGDLFAPSEILLSAYDRPEWDDSVSEWDRASAGWRPYTASFWDGVDGGYFKVPVDYVLATSDLDPSGGRVWNPLRTDDLPLYDASDHFPVSLTVDPG